MKIKIIIFIMFFSISSLCFAAPGPVLLAPVNNSVYSQVQAVNMQWYPVAGVSAYQYQVALDSSFTQIIGQGITTNRFVWQSNLIMGKFYYWRVRGFSPVTDWSLTWNYSFQYSASVDCVVSEWSEWVVTSNESCSHSSFKEWSERTRTVITQPANGGFACPVLVETRYLTLPCVSIDCVLSEWSEWSDETAWYCENYIKTKTESRTKEILVPMENGGNECGVTYESREVSEACEYSVHQGMSLWKINGTLDCYAEIAKYIDDNYTGTGQLMTANPTCYGSNSSPLFYHDSYESQFLALCNTASMVSFLGNGQCWPTGAYSNPTPGICCSSLSQDVAACSGGKLVISCDELIESMALLHPVSQAGERYENKTYLGEVVYTSGTVKAVYRLFADDWCTDTVSLMRSNDELSILHKNEEIYQWIYEYRGFESDVTNIVDVSVRKLTGAPETAWNWRDYVDMGTIAGPFTTKKIIDDFEPGLHEFDINVFGTQCHYRPLLFVGKPKFYYDCSGSGTKFGFEFVSSDGYDVFNPIYYTSFKVLRYPVDKDFKPLNPSVPMEVIKDSDYTFPKLGYITKNSGNLTDIFLEKGYIYRFVVDANGVQWSYDFSGWPCALFEVEGSSSLIEGVTSQVEGNTFVLPKPIFNGVQWKK